MELTRQEYLCNNMAYDNAMVAKLCGYPKVLDKLAKKVSVHN